MNFTNSVIKFNKTISILYCDKKLIKFYKKFNWRLANYKDFVIKIKKTDKKVIMIFK